MEIIVEVRDVYGKPLVYPVCRRSEMFAKIAESKTLTPRVLKTIRSLGYRVREMGWAWDIHEHNYGSLEFNRLLIGEAA
jgi:hypothetical protein